jgi:bleomycin hydrolase
MSDGFMDATREPRSRAHPDAPAHPLPAAELTPARLESLRQAFDSDPHARMMQNAAVRTRIEDVALSRAVTTGIDFTFSHVLDDWACTKQGQSGRCWMFAGLNLMRVGAMKKMNLANFEFSQTYTQFWDKLERANYFLEAIIDTSDRDGDDRTVAWLLDHPLDDGGQWNMFVALVHKHGLVPQAVMPETASSACTRTMNSHLMGELRQAAMLIRRAPGAAEQRGIKDDAIATVHRILCLHLGTPPERFEWQWNDKDRKFHRPRNSAFTPQQFAQEYVAVPLDEYVCLVHDPRPTSPVGRTFTVEKLGNVVGGEPVRYLNVPIKVMKDIAMRTIVAGEPVWFGCDVGKMMHRDLGVWDAALFDLAALYGSSRRMDKADRLIHHATAMTHAMLFTGVDVIDGRPRRWRVENSWGDEVGRKGFFTMNDSWFGEHMFEIATRKQYLPPDLLAALDADPIVLPPWDPMGALA